MMKTRMKPILSLALLSVLASTAMPTYALDNESGGSDELVFQVDLGLGTSPEEPICDGVSTLELPTDLVLDQSTNTYSAISDSTDISVIDVLDLFGYYGPGVLEDYGATYLYTEGQSNPTSMTYNTTFPAFAGASETYELLLAPDVAPPYGTLDSADFVDLVGFFRTDRETYFSQAFVVDYDADDCDSGKRAIVTASRSGVVRDIDDDQGPQDAETLFQYEQGVNGVDFDAPFAPANTGRAHLKLGTNVLEDGTVLPEVLAHDSYSNVGTEIGRGPVGFGESGRIGMSVALDIFGTNPTGRYSVTVGYRLEVVDQGLFGTMCYFYANCSPQ
jgi:hypothetical protein